MECHIQTWFNERWQDSAVITCPDVSRGGVKANTFFEYTLDYAFAADGQAVSLNFPLDANLHQLSYWPAFLYDLIPQGAGRNYLLGQLGLADGPGADFALICAGAFNPIGRLRIGEAVDYYQHHIGRHDPARAAGGLLLEQFIARDDAFAERMLVHGMLAAGTTGVQGAAPKYLLTRDRRGLWHADGALLDADAADHCIVKLPRGKAEVDKKILRNEAAYMRVAQSMGLFVHGPLAHHNDMLFIPRFDRTVQQGRVLRHHQESAAAIAGIVGFDARPSQFVLLRALRRVLTDKAAGTLEFLLRDVLNLAMRNTDNHARNTAVQVISGEVRLTPLYDFAPMYLDPEAIARAARWYHPHTGIELNNWHDVIVALELVPDEEHFLRENMVAFGFRLAGLADCMRDNGVDDDITSHLNAGIAEQCRQLRELKGHCAYG